MENRRDTERVAIRTLRLTRSLRRGGVDAQHVRALAAADGLPPILALRSTMEVIDGVHRVRAAELRGDDTVEVEFFDGSAADAFVLAVRRNVAHGLPLAKVDRIDAAVRILNSHQDWSDRRIAATSGLSARTVRALRARAPGDAEAVTARVGLDGRMRPVDPVEGRHRAAALLSSRPDAPLRVIAAEAGIGLGTVQDVRARLRSGRDVIPPKLGGTRDDQGGAVAQVTGPPVVPDFAQVVAELRSDPSLRYSDAGRTVLRLLAAHSNGELDRDRLVGSVPEHCSGGLARAARHCADFWARLATDIESKRVAVG